MGMLRYNRKYTHSLVLCSKLSSYFSLFKSNKLSCELSKYKYSLKNFSENESLPKSLSFKIIKQISLKNVEPLWISKFRIDAMRHLSVMVLPKWSFFKFNNCFNMDISYYSAILNVLHNFSYSSKNSNDINSIDQKIKNTAIDLVLDSISISTSYQKELYKQGIIFSNISDSINKTPDLVSVFLGSVISSRDNYFATLNSAVFSDGSFVYVPKNVACPLDISTYFRINGSVVGQFERTLIVCESTSNISYLEGCTASLFLNNQLHAAVVELFSDSFSVIKYSTIQNWYPGDLHGIGGILNFVTKRGLCSGKGSNISWTQVETGSSMTWKYPSVVLKASNSTGEFYSIAVTRMSQQADTGSKMVHIGKKSCSKIISKGISSEHASNCYRGLVIMHNNSSKSKNNTQCDSIIVGNSSTAITFPYILIKNPTSWFEHEASVAKIQDDQIFYLMQRCLSTEHAMSLLVGGFCKEVIEELPFEFLSEVNEILNSSLISKIG